MSGHDTSPIWRFFTRGPGLFYTWPFLPLFKYLPILFGSTPPEPRPTKIERKEKPPRAKPRRLLKLWKLLRRVRHLRIAGLTRTQNRSRRHQLKTLRKGRRPPTKAPAHIKKVPEAPKMTREEFDAWRRSHRAEPRPWERSREQSRSR